MTKVSVFIEETLRSCAVELMTRFRTGVGVSTKADASLVTEADLASERVALERIKSAFPEDMLLSEETHTSATSRPEGRHVWIVDPLDGTTNFANGYAFFCISIARGIFRKDGSIDVVAGGIMDPVNGNVYLAERGKGAWMDGKQLKVLPPRPLAKGFLVTGFYFTDPTRLMPEVERFARVATQCPAIRRDGSAALDLALVARGLFDGFWENGLKVWDVAAGALLVAEAGGVVQNYAPSGAGSWFDPEGPGIVAGNPATVASIAGLL
jgi:myo-inositol-1(or 4)-monophosphatase